MSANDPYRTFFDGESALVSGWPGLNFLDVARLDGVFVTLL